MLTGKRMLSKIMLPQDKANHLAYGMILYGVIGLLDTVIALVFVIVVAVGKEVADKLGMGTSDWKDAAATAGVPVGIETIRSLI